MNLGLTLLLSLVTQSSFWSSDQPVMEVCGFKFTEGPVWYSERWIFSDIPADTIFTLNKEVFRNPSGNSNGLAIDKNGQLLIAEHSNRRVSRLYKDGTLEVVAERFNGKRLNSPNDIAIHSDGTIYFTDPPYGLPGGLEGPLAELDFCGVYAVKTNGEIHLLNKNLKKPNGIALRQDEKALYVADTEQNAIFVLEDIHAGGLIKEKLFCSVPHPDGIKVDPHGNLWATSSDGIVVFSPKGERIAKLATPKQPANCAFGGKDHDELLVTARDCVYVYKLNLSNPSEKASESTHNSTK